MSAKRTGQRRLPREGVGQSAHGWEAAAVAALAIAVSVSSLRVPFVWDDVTVIVRNDHLRDVGNLKDLFSRTRYFARYGEMSYRPVVTFSYFVDEVFWGREPRWGLRAPLHHVHNVILHALCAVLVFWVARVVASGRWVPLAAGALFAVHPIQTEAVNAVCFREDLQCAALTLAALLAMRRAARSRRFVLWAVLSALCALAAGLAKETALVLPLMGILFDASCPDRRAVPTLRRLEAWASVAAGTVAYSVIRFVLMPAEGVPASVANWPLTFAEAFARYFRLIAFPIHQGVVHEVAGSALAVVVIVAFAAGAGWAWWRKRGVGFGLATFWLALVPVSGAVPIAQLMAERYLYLPMAGLSVAVGEAVFGTRSQSGRVPGCVKGILYGLVVAMFSLLTVTRTSHWTSDYALWSAALKVRPRNVTVMNNLGKGYSRAALLESGPARRGLLLKGISQWKRAAELDEEQGMPYLNVATTYAMLGEHEMAALHYERALARLGAGLARRDAFIRLAKSRLALGDRAGAANALERALREWPQDEDLRRRLGAVRGGY